MKNASAAVAALKGTVIVTVGIFIEIDAVSDKLLDILRGLGNENMQGFGVIGEGACDARIISMQLNIIVRRIPYARDAALSKCGVTEGRLTLGEHQHTQIFRQMQRSIASGSTRTGDYNIIILFKIHHKNGSFV